MACFGIDEGERSIFKSSKNKSAPVHFAWCIAEYVNP
jgi:hypothetical protein